MHTLGPSKQLAWPLNWALDSNMNKKQKQLIINWSVLLILFIFALINYQWVSVNWEWLRWPLLLLIFIVYILSGKETTGWGAPGVKLGSFIENYPLLKIWVAICTFSILLFLGISVANGVDLIEYSGTIMLIGLGSLILPLFIVSEIHRYKRLGNESNK